MKNSPNNLRKNYSILTFFQAVRTFWQRMKFYDKMGVKGCMGKGEKFMKTLGIDIGTTTISAVVADSKNQEVIQAYL